MLNPLEYTQGAAVSGGRVTLLAARITPVLTLLIFDFTDRGLAGPSIRANTERQLQVHDVSANHFWTERE